jgi:hypothetical protein
MRLQRRLNPLIGFIFLIIALFFAARSTGVLPEGLADLMVRAWPALLILAGLSILLRDRLPLSPLIALLATLILVGGVAAYAFNTRASQQREDNRQTLSQLLPAEVSLLRVRVRVLSTDVELLRSLQPSAEVRGEFVGSSDHLMVTDLEVLPDNSVTLTLTENRSSSFPFLETTGRGALQLELPPNLPMDVEFISDDGDIILNLSGTRLERLNVDSVRGDVIVTLPEYQPQFSETGSSLGTLIAENGSLTLRVPQAVAGRFELNRAGSGIRPQFDETVYNYLEGDVLEARLIESANVVLRYTLTAPRGLIRLDVPESGSN